MHFLILFATFSIAHGQQLQALNTFIGGNYRNEFRTGGPFGVYVSASSDSQNILSNIYVTTEEGHQISLNELRVRKILPDSGELEPWAVTSSAYLSTELTTKQLESLNGVIFLSTTSQLRSANFHVIDVSLSQTIGLQGLGDISSTILFINTNMQTKPIRSSIISQWSQSPNSQAFIYQGIPWDIGESDNSQIFSNPMQGIAVNDFFSSVETFSMATVAFYMKTKYGGPTFKIEPGYYSVDNTTTSNYTTTGFYMKETGKVDSSVTIHTKRDTRYLGSSGANIIGALGVGKVKIGEYDGASYENASVAPTDFIRSCGFPIGENLQISSEYGTEGQYFVQYYVYQGENTGTTPVNTETTTKSSGNMKFLISLIILMGFIGFL